MHISEQYNLYYYQIKTRNVAVKHLHWHDVLDHLFQRSFQQIEFPMDPILQPNDRVTTIRLTKYIYLHRMSGCIFKIWHTTHGRTPMIKLYEIYDKIIMMFIKLKFVFKFNEMSAHNILIPNSLCT